MKKFHHRIYDNFHYGDVNDFYKHGEFDTYEEALELGLLEGLSQIKLKK